MITFIPFKLYKKKSWSALEACDYVDAVNQDLIMI